MKKRSKLVAIMLLVVLSVMKLSVCADGSPGHNKALIKALFGNARVSDTDKMDLLNDACQLAIDQHNGDGQDTLNELKKTIRGLPDTIDSFNIGHGKLHRNYTHQGWDFEYKNDEAHWKDIRKKKYLIQSINYLILVCYRRLLCLDMMTNVTVSRRLYITYTFFMIMRPIKNFIRIIMKYHW